MILCVLKRILHKISQFSCNYWNPQFLLLLLLPSKWSFARGRPPLDDLFQEAGPSGSSFARGQSFILTTTKRAWKCIFDTLNNEIKCVLSVKESNFKEKRIKIFIFAYGQGRVGLPPPFPDRKISIFYVSPKQCMARRCLHLWWYFYSQWTLEIALRSSQLMYLKTNKNKSRNKCLFHVKSYT